MFRDILIRDTNILSPNWVPIIDRYTEERGTPPFPTLAPEGSILTAVLRTRDILVRIRMRIRILGSVPLTNNPNAETHGSYGSDPEHWHIYIILQSYIVIKKSQNRVNQGFWYYFCFMMEGSGSGSVPVTNGSGCGSGRPKNIRILWIRIQMRIRNTDR